ncbi:MAG TPA: hypothetical protein VIX63_01445 [Vicinamibacterales bacterium]
MSTHAIFQEIQANRDLMTGVLLTEIETLVAPLRRLDVNTRASIVALVGLAELATASEPALAGTDSAIAPELHRGLMALHGDGAQLLAGLRTFHPVGHPAVGGSPLEGLMDLLRCLGLPAPVPYERPRSPRPVCQQAAA